MKPGKVYLVGAGPGDLSLITYKAVEAIRGADVIIYDYLANKKLLEMAQTGAEKIYVGKKGASHTLPQGGINQLLVEKALTGKTIARLKGGDPFIFGRGGEEIEELIKHDIPFEVVPGITSAIAVPAYAGIPLTHRDFTSTVAFVTGHENPDKGYSAIAWDKISTGVGTLVFLMGVKNIPNICRRLIENGRPETTPAAVIRWGTTNKQQAVTGTLANIEQRCKEENIKPPSIFVVGEVVTLREKMNWFEKRPLFGKRVVVTRARAQASGMVKRLTGLGAEVIEFPTIRIEPPEDNYVALDQAITELDKYDWLIFTSVNGVKAFFKRLKTALGDIRRLGGIKISAIGSQTAQQLEDFQIIPDFVPAEYRAEGIIKGLTRLGISGKKVLIPRAREAREILPEELRKAGADVLVAPAYKTVPDFDPAAKELILSGGADVVTFASSSTVTNFAGLFTENELNRIKENTKIASIGPITSETARKLGLEPHIMPSTYTIDALVAEIVM
ncbi:MAG: uroporphyrinogen-III C-methyltransferase [bacterium]